MQLNRRARIALWLLRNTPFAICVRDDAKWIYQTVQDNERLRQKFAVIQEILRDPD